MIAKVIVWDETRRRAIKKLKSTLSECLVLGVHTNIPLVREMVSHPEFVEGTMTTQFVGQHFPHGLALRDRSEIELEFQKNANAALLGSPERSIASAEEPANSSPWYAGGGWSNV
jgi:acetyl/propionyl-CoA carboxylase alpha subunit